MERITKILSIQEQPETVNVFINGVIGYPADWQHDDPENIVTTSQDLQNELKALSKVNQNIEKIHLFIDSPGGSVNHALSMFNILDRHKAEKFVTYTGNSASAATVLAAVAKKENIEIAEYLAILVHEARVEAFGTAATMETIASDLKKTNNMIGIIYSNLNGLTVDENLKIMSENNGEGRLLTASEAFDLGFVGKISKINEKIAAQNLNNIGWSEYHKDKLQKFYNQFNTNMGIFKSKQITAETTEPEKEQPLMVGMTGEVEIGDKILKIENGLIIEILEKKTEGEPITETETKTETENEAISDALKAIENLKAENEKLINIINEAKLTIANPVLPVSEFSDEKANTQKIVNSRSYIYEVQRRKYENKLKNE